MTLTYFNDINVYFHMRNHYKMLKNVKSAVDTSVPQSLLKSPMAMNSLDKQLKGATNEHLRKIYNTRAQNQSPKQRGLVKKHNCLNSEVKSEACLSIDRFSSRPSTRRNDNATPKEPLPHRSYSTAPFYKCQKMMKFKQQRKRPSVVTRSNSSAEPATSLHLDLPQDNADINDRVSPPNSKRSYSSKGDPSDDQTRTPVGSAEDHEYLLFLLRITEDIISNDFYANSDIKKIFKSHMELNKDRLSMRKMHLHISNLCKELNIDCKEYQTAEVADQPDSLNKFQNAPNGHSFILSSEAFKSCRDCSVIRTSSLYKMQSLVEDCNLLGDNLRTPLMGNMGDVTPVSPSLLKLLEKLSLGRVTERTEPVASTSTINSSRLNVSSSFENIEVNNEIDEDKGPTDFDTFVKELNSKETNLEAFEQNSQVGAALDDTSGNAVADQLNDKSQELIKNPIALESVNETATNIDALQPSIEGSKTDIAFSEKNNVTNSYNTSDFEKCSSSNSTATIAQKPEKLTKDLDEEIVENVACELKAEGQIATLESNIPILIKETDKLLATQLNPIDTDDGTTASSKSLVALTLSPKQCANTKLSHSVPNSARSNTFIKKVQPHLTQPDTRLNDSESTFTTSQESLKQIKSIHPNVKQPEQSHNEAEPSTLTTEKIYLETSSNLNTQKKGITIILQDSIKDEDYVMIKGPVYVYKPLLDSDPKLIVFAENPEHSRRNSSESHKTFTVDHTGGNLDHTNLDQCVQYDASLHSLEADASMENILELTRTAYSQFMDMKLLESDYDLTPEKDSSDNKYHHLLLDATTSISGVNISESLLLSDEYLVQNDCFTPTTNKNVGESREDVAVGNIIDDLGVRRFQPKICENTYVLHRKLTSSISMPRLKLNSDGLSSGRTEKVLRKCPSDLIHFDLPSQDSSLRSEGEAVHNIGPK